MKPTQPSDLQMRIAKIWNEDGKTARQISAMFDITEAGVSHALRRCRGWGIPIAVRAVGSRRKTVLQAHGYGEVDPRNTLGLASLEVGNAPSIFPQHPTKGKACCWPMWRHGERPGVDPKFCEKPIFRRGYCAKHDALAWTSASPLTQKSDSSSAMDIS